MLPRIKSVEIGKIHINEDIITSDFFIHANGVEQTEKTRKVGKKDFERMALIEPDTAIFGTGFKKNINISPDILDAAKKSNINVHVLSTPDALKKFQDLARKGKKVIAHIHIGE